MQIFANYGSVGTSRVSSNSTGLLCDYCPKELDMGSGWHELRFPTSVQHMVIQHHYFVLESRASSPAGQERWIWLPAFKQVDDVAGQEVVFS